MPSSRIAPAAAACRPMIARSSVVFPAPLRPHSVTISPAPTRSDTSRTAYASPYATETASTSSRCRSVTMSGSQVGVDDSRVGTNLAVAAFGEHPPGREHGDPVGQLGYDVHVVLDHHHGPAVADPRDEVD